MLPLDSACSVAPFGRLACSFPALLTLLQTDNFPKIMYPSALCRIDGSPRFVVLLTLAYVFISHLTLLNVFLATYFEEFRRHRKWRERSLQKRERRTLVLLYMILVAAAHRRERRQLSSWQALLSRVMRGDALLPVEPWALFYVHRAPPSPLAALGRAAWAAAAAGARALGLMSAHASLDEASADLSRSEA